MNKSLPLKSLIAKVFLIVLFVACGVTASLAVTFTVTKVADTNDGVCDTDCSLREAIAMANSSATDNIIQFDSTVFSSPQTIELVSGELLIAVGSKLTINGPGAQLLKVHGNVIDERVFHVDGNATVTFNALTIYGRADQGFGGGILIFFADVTLNDSTVTNCLAQHGGGIENRGGLVHINRSTISANSTTDAGGGILNANSLMEISNSTISNNSADHYGAGIYNINAGSMNLNNVTISNNAGAGIGSGPGAGGVENTAGAGAINVHSSIISGNSGGVGPDFHGTLTSQGYNLIGNVSGTTIVGTSNGNILGQDPHLSPLRDNGGATMTNALLPSSPAVDAGDPANPPNTDQRGFSRPSDGNGDGLAKSDIGAYELRSLVVTNASDSGPGSLRQSITDALTQADAVVFDPTTFNVPQIITLTSGYLSLPRGANIAINGTDSDKLTISGDDRNRIFFIDTGATIAISNMTLANGNGADFLNKGGAIENSGTVYLEHIVVRDSNVSPGLTAGTGGAIQNDAGGKITIVNSTMRNNKAKLYGGAIFSSGEVDVENSLIQDNTAGLGSAIRMEGGSSKLTINGSRILHNLGSNSIYLNNCPMTTISYSTISFNDGGISDINFSTLLISSSTVSNNVRGGLSLGSSSATASVVNSTISYNGSLSSFGSSGINNAGTLSLTNTTIAYNTNNMGSSSGGVTNTGTLTANNSIIADNVSSGNSPDFSGTLTSQGYNLIGNTGGTVITGNLSGNILGKDPMLDPNLTFNGGSTPTHALRVGSPAIDKGSVANPQLSVDQRGLLRPFNFPAIPNASGGNGSDIGAFERQASDVSGVTISDFDGDGKSDISVWRDSDGNWYWINNTNSTFSAFHFGMSGDVIVPGDYDGDGKTDLAVFRNGTWYIQASTAGFSGTQFGLATDLPVQGDFDGDGKTDIAVFRPSNGTWYLLQSMAGFAAPQFGTNGDKPVVGDYDGDGKADIAVYRPSDGNWYQLRSTAGFAGVHFGISIDKVVPADYDGDGKTDLAVYRDGSPGNWYLLESTAGFVPATFGTSGDIPVPGDFDGDGKADTSVFRPSNGTWYLQRSTSGFAAQQFGAATDRPVEASYVPVQ